QEIMFSSQRAGPYQIYRRAAANGGSDALVVASDIPAIATDWSRDGRSVVFTRTDKGTGLDVWTMELAGGRTPIALTTAAEDNGAVSASGRWFLFQSNTSGRDEVYVESIGVQTPIPISKGGGTQPLWRADGKELFFLAPDGSIMAAEVITGQMLAIGTPRK